MLKIAHESTGVRQATLVSAVAVLLLAYALPSYAGQDCGHFIQTSTTPSIPRFSDNSDGTITDNHTGLVWLKNAECFGMLDWQAALTAATALAAGDTGDAAKCGLVGGSAARAWRLPSIDELHSLIDYRSSGIALPHSHLFTNVQPDVYWSSTSNAVSEGDAWVTLLNSGFTFTIAKHNTAFAWPVRDR